MRERYWVWGIPGEQIPDPNPPSSYLPWRKKGIASSLRSRVHAGLRWGCTVWEEELADQVPGSNLGKESWKQRGGVCPNIPSLKLGEERERERHGGVGHPGEDSA